MTNTFEKYMVKGGIINSKNCRKGNDYIIIKTKKEIITAMIARITTRIAAGKQQERQQEQQRERRQWES